MTVRVAVLDDYQGVALSSADWSPLEGRAEIVVFRDRRDGTDALAERLADFDVIVAMRERTPFPRELLARLPRLRLLVTTGMGNASFDIAAAQELGITVCGTVLFDVQTAELAWALIMAAMRSIAEEDRAVRAGRWQTTLGRELAGSTLGLAGLGELGQRIARWAHAFDMTVLAWSPHLDPALAREHGVEAVGKDALFERSDIVSVHLRLAPSTIGLVGERELRLLGPRGLLVNTSRGPIVEEAALVNALNSGTIAGAALDVFDSEPLGEGHPLLSTPRTTLSPHKGFVAENAYRASYGEAVGDIVAWLAGSPVRILTA